MPASKLAFPGLIASCFALVSCLNEHGLVDPHDDRNNTSLADFHGRAANEHDSALSSRRFLQLSNPQVSLVWQSMGPHIFGHAFDKSTVGVAAPYRFSLDMTHPPQDGIALSKDPVIGAFWLYSDGNHNGVLDRLINPELEAREHAVDSMKVLYTAFLDSLHAYSRLLPNRVPVKDTYFVDAMGTIVYSHGSILDTVYLGRSPQEAGIYPDLLYWRYRIMRNYNEWENFFALRKKAQEEIVTSWQVPGHAIALEYQDWRKLVPIPGKEAQYQKWLVRETLAYSAYLFGLLQVQREAAKKGWMEYPYQGFDTPGEDWVAGKSRWYSVLYFPDQAGMQTVLDAEKSGSFRVDGIEKLKRGYNFMYCDEQYDCRVLGSADSIIIDLGETEAYFNPPSAPLALPVREFKPVSLPDTSYARLTGGYDYRAFHPITVVYRKGGLWAEVSGKGLYRLSATDALRFYAMDGAMQFEFVPEAGGRIRKLLLYADDDRWVSPKADSLARTDAVARMVDSLAALGGVPISGAFADALPLRLQYGGDSALLTGSDGILKLELPGSAEREFRPIGDSEAVSGASLERIILARNRSGTVIGIRFGNAGGESFLPASAYRPRSPLELFPRDGLEPVPPDSAGKILSASQGSGRDTHVGLGGTKRFGCAEDQLYLRPGDGGLLAFKGPASGDSISVYQAGGAMVFAIAGAAGKRVSLELNLCKERNGKPGRLWMGIRGGGNPENPKDRIAESRWVTAVDSGTVARWDDIPVPTDPYYLEIGSGGTPEAPFFFSMDAYVISAD
ncbi:MAG: hypothetical protein JWP91_2524 [Fibrobacteres bacterium]|nr:hypothetical protein [Fibrobacterota bacterium]